MKATCPKDPKHDRFITVVHVTEDWVVNRAGGFEAIANSDGELVAPPHPDNTWTCEVCGAEAKVDV